MPFDQGQFEIAPSVVEAPVSDEVLRCLIDGRARIAKASKWTKGAYCLTGQMCAMGALTDNWSDWNLDASAALFSALPAGQRFGCVENYNDAHTTTHADVLSLFDRAIAARKSELSHPVSTGGRNE